MSSLGARRHVVRLVVLALLLVSTPSVAAAPSFAAAAALGPPIMGASGDQAFINVRWTAPRGTVTGYQLSRRTYNPGRRTWSSWSTLQLGRSIRARSLRGANGSLHQVRVRALSRRTPGAFSRMADVRVGVPGVAGALSRPAPTSLRISWTAPTGYGAKITSYLLGLRSYDASRAAWTRWSSTPVNPASRAFVFQDLTAGARYQARIVARNRYGSGGATLLSVVLPAASIPVPVPVPTRPRSPGLSVNSIKVVVALSSDDTQAPPLGPAIVHELGLVSGWYASQTGGRRPRFVGAGGVGGLVPEVTTVVLRKTAAELEAAPDILVATLAALAEVFPRTPGDRVFVYSDVKGSACGHTTDTADTVVIWMMTCSLIPSENTPGFPYGATYVAAHEMTHMFGAVPACAPHSDGTRHVNDDPTDMLYAGGSAVTKAVLDPGHDDYYGHGRTDCPDIATSPLWQ